MAAIDAVSVTARRAVLEVMMHVAWADREITPEESQAARAAAIALGLVLPGDEALATTYDVPPTLDGRSLADLAPRDRDLVYVCAEWMALADSIRQAEEMAFLSSLRAHLGIGEPQAQRLRSIATALHERQVVEKGSWWRAFDRLVVEAARSLAAEATADA